jgi:hypothetical protein
MLQRLPASVGTKSSAASFPVVLASDQAAIPVTGNFFQATQPVSVAALPLPSGAATETTLGNVLTSTNTIGGRLPTSVGTKNSANSLSVVLASDQANVNVVVQSSVLPTGAANSTNQTALNAAFGANTDTTAATDSANVSLISLTKRELFHLNNISVAVSNTAAQNVAVFSSALPTGAATSAKQDTIIAGLGGITDVAAASDSANVSLISLTKRISGHLAVVANTASNTSPANTVSQPVAPTNVSSTCNATATTNVAVTIGTQCFEFWNLSDTVLWCSWNQAASNTGGVGNIPIPAYANGVAGYYSAPSGMYGTFSVIAASGTGKAFTAYRGA